MNFNSLYYEKYALLCLAKCIDKKLEKLLSCKAESPDWQSEEYNIGIEVVNSMSSQKGELNFFISKHFNQHKSGEFIKKCIKKENPKLEKFFHTVENVSYVETDFSGKTIRNNICSTIKKKVKLLNSNYKKFKNNWLFVFAHYSLEKEEILDIISTMQNYISDYDIFFDRIFVNCIDTLYVIDKNGILDIIYISYADLRNLKKESLT